uniref:Uncharacterized protein n=1 Tax=viral metagenome TaxID=1070528 RepID=A0A6C0DLS8_9ZZZZ
MQEFLINKTRNQYIQLAYGISHLYYLRQVSEIWDIHNDIIYYELRIDKPDHLENMTKFIERYN